MLKKTRICIICHKKKSRESFTDKKGVNYKSCKTCREKEVKNGKDN